jgi:hypothetical protein
VEYKITNVPAVSDFKTSTIEGEDISPKFNNDSQRNYFQAGFGNYSKFLADGNISYEINKDTEVGVDVHGLSTNGLKKIFLGVLSKAILMSQRLSILPQKQNSILPQI